MDKVKNSVQKIEDKLSGDKDPKVVLVTGATSYVATYVIKEFLNKGYHIRAQVRNQNSADKVSRAFPDVDAAKLEFTFVEDIIRPGAWDAAVQGVDGVVHTASPFVLQVEDNERDLLDPAIKGTKEILEAVAKKAPQVKRVVITSSFAAMVDLAQGYRPGYTYSEKDWNPVTYEAAKAGGGAEAYCASKTFAERAAWDFVEARKPNFSVATICPPMIYGPPAHDVSLANLNTSVADIYRLMDGSTREAVPPTAFPLFADVRNVGQAHLAAFEHARGGRYFVTSGPFLNEDVCQLLRRELPGHVDRIPVPDDAAPRPDVYQVDNSKAVKELGIRFIPLEECIRDMARSLVKLEEKAQKA